MARGPLRFLLATCLGSGLAVAYATYRIWSQGERDELRLVGAIVVLGAAQHDGQPSPVFRARLDHAIRLWLDGWAPYLVATGGKQAGDRVTEAEVAREYARQAGVPADAILVEDGGRTTLESIRAVAAMLRARGIMDAVFVSDPTHMLRVLRIARDVGIVAWGSPTRTSPTEHDLGRRLEATVHEIGALALYLARGEGRAGDLGAPAH